MFFPNKRGLGKGAPWSARSRSWACSLALYHMSEKARDLLMHAAGNRIPNQYHDDSLVLRFVHHSVLQIKGRPREFVRTFELQGGRVNVARRHLMILHYISCTTGCHCQTIRDLQSIHSTNLFLKIPAVCPPFLCASLPRCPALSCPLLEPSLYSPRPHR